MGHLAKVVRQMIIDTGKITTWAERHLRICLPVATGLLSWFAAMRWQAALDSGKFALEIFYFFVSAVSGIVTAILAIVHFARLGFFE